MNPRTDIISIASPTTHAIGSGAVNGLTDFAGGIALGKAINMAWRWLNGPVITNPVPKVFARAVPNGIKLKTIGDPRYMDDPVFITAADDIAGMTSAEIAKRLAIPESPTGFQIVEFLTPDGLTSPIFSTNPRFVGRGQTLGGAREFAIPNGPLPPGATIRIVPP